MRPSQISEIVIAEILHTIWAGGDKLMRPQGVQNVMEWAKKNPECSVWIWVDTATALGNDEEEKKHYLLKGYNEIFNGHGYKVRYDDSQFSNNDGHIILKDITALWRDPWAQLFMEYVLYEIRKLKPNYGASSDLLRYIILWLYSGIYFDCTDVGCGTHSLKEAGILGKKATHELYVDHLSQRSYHPQEVEFRIHPTEDDRIGRGIRPCIGNDIFFCTKHNPLMEQILRQAIANYQFLDLANSLDIAAEYFQLSATYDANSIKEQTIGRTGPECVRFAIGTKGDKKTSSDRITITTKTGEIVDLLPTKYVNARGQEILLNTSQRSTHFWLVIPIANCNSVEEAYSRVLLTIKFELTHFRILRLEDHVNDLLLSVKHLQLNINAVKAQLFERIEQEIQKQTINLAQVDVVQLLYVHKEVIAFYKKYQLLDKTHTDIKVYYKMAVFRKALSICYFESCDLLTYAQNNELHEIFDKRQLKEIAICIHNGLQFIYNQLQQMSQPVNKQEHCNVVTNLKNFTEALNCYSKIIQPLNVQLTQDEQIDQEEIVFLQSRLKQQVQLLKEAANNKQQQSSLTSLDCNN